MASRKIIFRQLFDRTSCTYSYLLGDTSSRNALLIDPVLELVGRDLKLLDELDLKLKYVLNTHVHADHVTGSGRIKQQLQALRPQQTPQSVISRLSRAQADRQVDHLDELSCGPWLKLQVRCTPGHTNGCVTYVDHANQWAFTGDALLIRGCGRTDFQEGSADRLYQSVWTEILSLPEHFQLYPAHDYAGQTSSTVGEEKRYNARLRSSQAEFVQLMDNLKLERPKLIDSAVPRNMACGLPDSD